MPFRLWALQNTISCRLLLSFSPGGETCSERVRTCPRSQRKWVGKARVWVQIIRCQILGSSALCRPCVFQWIACSTLGLKGRAWERSQNTKQENSKETKCHLLVMSWIKKKIQQSWWLHLRFATCKRPLLESVPYSDAALEAKNRRHLFYL